MSFWRKIWNSTTLVSPTSTFHKVEKPKLCFWSRPHVIYTSLWDQNIKKFDFLIKMISFVSRYLVSYYFWSSGILLNLHECLTQLKNWKIMLFCKQQGSPTIPRNCLKMAKNGQKCPKMAKNSQKFDNFRNFCWILD